MTYRRKHNKPLVSKSLASSLQFLNEDVPCIEFSSSSSCIATTTVINHGFKGVRFSPDGTCVLTSDGKQCHIYEPNCPPTPAAVSITEGEPIYNYSWFPAMDSTRPETCCFAVVCKNTPVHLWDAYESNKLRASYQLVTKEMEPIWALSVELTTTNVFAGLDHWIYMWDLTRPGAPVERIKTRRRGMVCAMDFNLKWSCFGTYSGYVLAASNACRQQVELEQMVFPCGVSQVKFLPQCEYQLMVSGRRAREIVCLDLRNCAIVQRIPRVSINNQRLEFDLLGDLLAFGNGSNVLEVWRGEHKVGETSAFASGGVVNGVSFNRTSNSRELAVATGTRPKPNLKLDDSDNEEDDDTTSELMLWKYTQ